MPIFINTLFFIDMHDVNKSLNKVFTHDTLVETKELTRLSITAKCGLYLYQARGNKNDLTTTRHVQQCDFGFRMKQN